MMCLDFCGLMALLNVVRLQVLVYVRVVFLKIGEIDTMKENFMADAFVQARWREPALDGQQAQVGAIVHPTLITTSIYLHFYSYSKVALSAIHHCKLSRLVTRHVWLSET